MRRIQRRRYSTTDDSSSTTSLRRSSSSDDASNEEEELSTSIDQETYSQWQTMKALLDADELAGRQRLLDVEEVVHQRAARLWAQMTAHVTAAPRTDATPSSHYSGRSTNVKEMMTPHRPLAIPTQLILHNETSCGVSDEEDQAGASPVVVPQGQDRAWTLPVIEAQWGGGGPQEQLPEHHISSDGSQAAPVYHSWCDMHATASVPHTGITGRSPPNARRRVLQSNRLLPSSPPHVNGDRRPNRVRAQQFMLTPLPHEVRCMSTSEAHDYYFSAIRVPESFDMKMRREAAEAQQLARMDATKREQAAAMVESQRREVLSDIEKRIVSMFSSEAMLRKELDDDQWRSAVDLFHQQVEDLSHALRPTYPTVYQSQVRPAPTDTSRRVPLPSLEMDDSPHLCKPQLELDIVSSSQLLRELYVREQSLLWLHLQLWSSKTLAAYTVSRTTLIFEDAAVLPLIDVATPERVIPARKSHLKDDDTLSDSSEATVTVLHSTTLGREVARTLLPRLVPPSTERYHRPERFVFQFQVPNVSVASPSASFSTPRR